MLFYLFQENFFQDNLTKLIFTGAAAIVIGVIAKLISDSKKKNLETTKGDITNNLNNTNTFNPTLNLYTGTQTNEVIPSTYTDPIDKKKSLIRILFVDDDTKFKVVNILKKSGWINTKAVKDIYNLDEPTVKEAHIVFVDVQGVGKELDCKDEGLGLALTLKKKYPNKKIIIYSTETQGDRFHEALRKADSFLAKNAEPYEFQQLVEEFSDEIIGNV